MEMLLYKISYLATAIGGIFIIIFILFRRAKVRFNILYVLTNFSMAIWAIGRYSLLVVEDYQAALIWVRILYIGSILVHLFFLHTVLVFLNIDKKRKLILGFFYLNAITISLVNLFDLFFSTSFFIKDVVSKLDFYYYEEPGFFYNLHLINYLFIPQYAFIEMLIAFKRIVGIKRNQLKYILASSIFGFVGGNSVVPLIYNIPFNPIAVFFVPIHLFTMAYAIFKLRLMDIRAIIFRSISFALIISIIASAYSIITVFLSQFFTFLVGTQSNIIAGIIVAILVVVGYHPLRRAIENVTNKFLYKKSYDPDVVQGQVKEAASSILNLNQLLTTVCGILTDAFHCEKIGVALLDKKKKLYIAYQEGFKPDEAEKLAQGKERVMNLQFKQTPGILVLDEMKTRYENGEFKPVSPKVLAELYEHDLALILPLYVKEKLIGIFVLGSKKSGDPYNQADLRLLNLLAGQAAVAVENATLYEEQKRFNEILKAEVNKATAELIVSNQKLKKTDENKSEFLSIASHQLRTPLTHIKSGLSMILEGDYGQISDPSRHIMKILFSSNERLIILVRDLLNLSRIEAGKMEYTWQKVDLVKLVQEVVFMHQATAQAQGLKLELLPAKVPTIIADEEKLHEVMYNFVDNAVKYTKQGKIAVSLKAEPEGLVTFSVQDTGRGIDQDTLPRLFQKFSRGKQGYLAPTEGLGIGLYIARQFITAHEGKIWAESPGENKGATFSFSVPIAGPKVKPKPVSRKVQIKTPEQLAEEAKR